MDIILFENCKRFLIGKIDQEKDTDYYLKLKFKMQVSLSAIVINVK